jgi:hypothetical protein
MAAGGLGGIFHWSPELLHRPPQRSHQKRARGSEGRGGSCSAEEREAARMRTNNTAVGAGGSAGVGQAERMGCSWDVGTSPS